ncbi:MAG: pyridoxal-phosphate dependent enzyme [candidate division NC10 bacterium]|nr:pyridoxal-phosphate dependent enzyme [candidate division NC10 bacterium]MBI2458210.1 pyridoxal-phosphate dependent enzyme [candidate division NC10 bacterium]MBI2562281.1 pyridoxal-phosphate dependent enzyme [candidate division NC10 bacterium]
MPAEMVCATCQAAAPPDTLRWRCPCGGLYDLRATAAFPRDALRQRPQTLWRYREALPLPPGCDAVSLGEPITPLLPWPALPGSHLKLEFLLPTGSFKDRGACVMLTRMKGLGIRAAVEDSSGNAAAAVAAYAARAGIACRIFVPASASSGKLAQIAAYGADVVPVPGSREDVAAAARTEAERSYYASHVFNPYFFQGTKTFAFEIWEQLGFRAPDQVILPVGHGTLYLGAYLGFRDLLKAGEIPRLPRLIGIQAEACAPLVAAWCGRPTAGPVVTIAEGIRIAAPDRAEAILQACRESDGELLAVSDEEIVSALFRLGRAGLYVEPTAAVAPAGALKLAAAGRLPAEGIAVIPLTGSGLKAGSTIAELLKRQPGRGG